jgi:hypothetical protein
MPLSVAADRNVGRHRTRLTGQREPRDIEWLCHQSGVAHEQQMTLRMPLSLRHRAGIVG